MLYPLLYKSLINRIEIPLDVYHEFEERIIVRQVKKKEFLITEGSTIKFLPFINKGLLVNYRQDDKGNTHVLQIRYNEGWLGDLHSFFSKEPTYFNIQAFQDSELLMVDNDAFEFITNSYPLFERYLRIGIQSAYHETLMQVFNLNSQTAEKRYHNLVNKNPTVLADIPHYMIASYLGIQPQTLSRIRKNS